MPEHEEHCLHSLKRYGVRGDEIHAWIDEPSQIAGGSHRSFRHDLASLPTAIQLFSEKYGADMVENIFLDHLKADSEENRKHEQELEITGSKIWSQTEDNFLYANFLKMSDEMLEANLPSKKMSEIRQRREYLGLVRPKMIRRTRKTRKIQKIVFKLTKGQKIKGRIQVRGGNNDIYFGMFNYQGNVNRLRPKNPAKIINSKSYSYEAQITGNYCFYFDNSFSLVAVKDIIFAYQFENGKPIEISFSI